MARNDKDFRSDQLGNSDLTHFYLTEKQRKSLLKWLLFGVVGLVLQVLQDVLLSRANILGGTTDLIPCFILLSCVLLDAETGVVFCLVESSLYVFSGSAPGTYVIILLTALGAVSAIFRQAFLRKGFNAAILCAGTAMVIYELAIFFVGLFLGLTNLSRMGVFLATGIVSVAVMPLLYPILSAIGKIGGESWKE